MDIYLYIKTHLVLGFNKFLINKVNWNILVTLGKKIKRDLFIKNK